MIRTQNPPHHSHCISTYLFVKSCVISVDARPLSPEKNHSKEQTYLDAIKKEIEWIGRRVDRARPVIQLHLGGGTPTYFSEGHLDELMNQTRNCFSFDAKAEIGVEADPRVTTIEHLKTLRRCGFNRLSMGVQDFDPTVQETINRLQPFAKTKALFEKARELGFESINMDLIYGLPHQTPESFRKTVEQILSIGPDRLAVYSYAHVPWMKRYQESFAAALPSERQKYEIFLSALELFTAAGFEYIGMDHFARPNDELAVARKERTLWRNFQGYTTKAGTDLIGIGMSSISQIGGNFFQNAKDLRQYQDKVAHGQPSVIRGFRLSADDRIRSKLIQNLLCHAVVVKADIEKEFGIVFDDYFSEPLGHLGDLIADGLVEITKTEIRPTLTGRVFLRNIAMPFDAYLPKEAGARRFSRTV
jgi:oxygen-independent coproporphyrinogen-3 oxidase